jgi:hypothetical protein
VVVNASTSRMTIMAVSITLQRRTGPVLSLPRQSPNKSGLVSDARSMSAFTPLDGVIGRQLVDS